MKQVTYQNFYILQLIRIDEVFKIVIYNILENLNVIQEIKYYWGKFQFQKLVFVLICNLNIVYIIGQ